MNDTTERVLITGSIAIFGIAIAAVCWSLSVHTPPSYARYPNAKGTILPKYPLPASDNHKIFEVKGTYYNPVSYQCDATPLETADGSRINLFLLKSGQIKWVALSRDLLKRWNGPFEYGDTLYVFHSDKRIKGMWIVHDSMNARFRKRIDFLRAQKGKFPGVARNILISNKSFYNKR